MNHIATNLNPLEAAMTVTLNRYQPAPKFLARPGGRIAYDDAGEGRLAVLVPGMGDLRAEYRLLVPELLAAGYRVVAMDVRGHGQSSTGWSDYSASAIGSDVVALLRQLDAGPALLVGTSMGAGVVAWAAAEAPDLVRGTVLVGPFVRDPVDMPKWKLAVMQAVMAVGFNGPWGPAAWGAYFASLFGTAPADLADYKAALVANLREPGRMDALRGMLSASKADAAARLHEVTAPVLVVMGTKDPDFTDPKREADAVAGLLRGSVLMVEGAGHYPQVEQPALVAGAIVAFDRAAR
jgi:pimeloyl-ACP methyl ester carboxylesterase